MPSQFAETQSSDSKAIGKQISRPSVDLCVIAPCAPWQWVGQVVFGKPLSSQFLAPTHLRPAPRPAAHCDAALSQPAFCALLLLRLSPFSAMIFRLPRTSFVPLLALVGVLPAVAA